MLPYGSLAFFVILLFILLPAAILGFQGRNVARYGLLATCFMIVIILGDDVRSYLLLGGFYLYELILIKTYLVVSPKTKNSVLFYGIILLSLIPMVLFRSVETLYLLGVSYLSFRTVQILMEIRDGLIKDISLFEYSYFLLFFPTLSSGPIDRSRRFNQDINKPLPIPEYQKLFKSGIYKIFLGLAYKFIIGVIISVYWMKGIPWDGEVFNSINYMYAYSLYLFFDFAGYSLMAVGVSHILGIKIMDNFNMPFISKDIKEFWNRWHMSLAFWFRDFIYTRFVMTAIKGEWFKSKLTASYIGFFLTMTTMGVWHGAEKHYLVYGSYHGMLMILTDLLEKKTTWYDKSKKSGFGTYVNILITFHLVCFGLLIFSGYFNVFVKNQLRVILG